jgi:putative hydrolase of the HAD superfamily
MSSAAISPRLNEFDAFVFDIGNVLVRFDYSRAIERFVRRSPLAPDDIRGCLSPLIAAMECGQLAPDGFVEQGMQATGFAGTSAEFISAYTEIFEVNTPIVPLVVALNLTHPLHLLSNTSALHLDYLRNSFAVFKYFSGGVFSHEARSMKPDRAIFLEAIRQCHLNPARTLFLDDSAANTAAAAKLGFHVFTYDWRDHAALCEFLRSSPP